jgi:hypothetical protein
MARRGDGALVGARRLVLVDHAGHRMAVRMRRLLAGIAGAFEAWRAPPFN